PLDTRSCGSRRERAGTRHTPRARNPPERWRMFPRRPRRRHGLRAMTDRAGTVSPRTSQSRPRPPRSSGPPGRRGPPDTTRPRARACRRWPGRTSIATRAVRPRSWRLGALSDHLGPDAPADQIDGADEDQQNAQERDDLVELEHAHRELDLLAEPA